MWRRISEIAIIVGACATIALLALQLSGDSPGARLGVVVALAVLAGAIVVAGIVISVRPQRFWQPTRRQMRKVINVIVHTPTGRSIVGLAALLVAMWMMAEFAISAEQGDNVAAFERCGVALLAALTNYLLLTASPDTSESTASLRRLRAHHVFIKEDESGPVIDLEHHHHVRFRIEPRVGAYWRFGFKFSQLQGDSANGRFGTGFPLWHVGKDAERDVLFMAYFDEHGQQATPPTPVISPYQKQEVAVSVDVTEQLRVTVGVAGSPGFSESYDLQTHRYLRPSAWADGQNDFQIVVSLGPH